MDFLKVGTGLNYPAVQGIVVCCCVILRSGVVFFLPSPQTLDRIQLSKFQVKILWKGSFGLLPGFVSRLLFLLNA